MEYRSGTSVPIRAALLLSLALASLLAALGLALAPAQAGAQENKRILLYTGTTGFRHTDAINNGRPVVQQALQDAGYTVDWEDCTNNGGGTNNCDHPNKNPRIFTDENLERYDAILLLNSSAGPPGPLWSDAQKAAIIRYVQNGGGIAGVHNATDMGTTAETWNWWDGNNGNSVVGATMAGHAATNINNVGQIQVTDHNHLSTRDLPDQYGFGDEHYNFRRNVRGSHHVLATIDERTYTPGSNAMGQDHPITWCKLYDGDNVNDNTGTPKPYNDGRTWVTSMGHFGASYTENGGNNNLVKTIVGGVRWVAGEGRKSDCSGTVWSSFTRTVLVPDANNAIGIDVAKDGKVYWSEIGNPISLTSTGYIKMHDPAKEPGNKTTVVEIPTRADHGNSEDGVLGMTLQPGFDLSDPNKRHLFVYYSPRHPDWPMSGNAWAVGWNQISRFTLTADGTSVVPGSERVILRVPKAKIAGTPSGFPGGPANNGPGHVGGAGLDFDSEGNLYLGVGDDVAPGAQGHNNYPPMDYRAAERWDARKTSQNTADLRGKVVRIKPSLGDIPEDAEPGLGSTYTVPPGNLFPVGQEKTRPEIYAMGFRQPFTVHADPENPGIVGVGEFCHDNGSAQANRSPAGTCEWNLIDEPSNHGWPFCVGDNSAANSTFRWNYANGTSTGERYDCNQPSLPSDIRWAPEGQTAAEPTFDGLDTVPGPVTPATIWKKYDQTNVPAFGDLSAGGMSPVAGPIYRYPEGTAGQGAFPRYYDGSWIINNRGSESGFWKEVRMRSDNNEMLRVQDWLPYNHAGSGSANANGFVIGSEFGPDGALYLARFSVGCCRSNTNANQQTQIVKISFNVQDECLTDESAPNVNHQVTGQPYPGEENTFVNSASFRLTANDVGCAGVSAIEYREQGDSEWKPYSSAVTFDEGKTYTIEYRAIDRMDNVSAVKTATFTVLEIQDETAPTANATTSGNVDQRGFFVGSTTLTITAEDDATGSGVDKIEYRVNGGEYTTYAAPVAFNAPGSYDIDYRATDKVQNTSEPKRISFRILSGAGCTQARSDEFNGSALGPQWLRHTRNGGTPTEGQFAPTVADGVLTMPTHNFELDASSSTTALGPVNFVGQDLASLGNNWSVETQLTVEFTGGWQHAGLIVWNGDNNFFRSTITHELNGGHLYVEQSKDNPTSAEGARTQAGNNVTIVPSKQPVTIRMRYSRVNGSNTVQAQYRVIAPASAANPDWVNFPGASNFLDLNQNPRRDAAGSRIGIIAAGNFPGTTGAHAYPGTPGTVKVDYFRVTPDPIECETVAPTTTATLDPAAPATGDTYDRSVKVNLSATDGGENAAGVEKTEYRITTNGNAGEWTTLENTASDSPFNNQLTISSSGTHLVEFRSTDKAANVEETKAVTFKIQLPVCDRSDEFDGTGTELRPQWLRHTRNGGTPTEGELAPRLNGAGQLILPTHNFELDNNTERTALGPVNMIGQDLPSLGNEWQVETQFTARYTGGWQHVGLIVWLNDGNFFRSTLTHSLSGGHLYVEQSKDNPGGNPEGTRQTAGSNRTVAPDKSQALTIKMRYTRAAGSNTVVSQYQIVAPASLANDDWVTFPGAANFLDLNPANGPRRDSAGSRVGIISAGNFPGESGAHAYPGTPADVKVDYFRVTPDNCPDGADTTAPTSSATTAPAAPNGTNGWFNTAVNVTLEATDNDNGSGVDKIEYRVDGGDFATYSGPIAIAADGEHTVEYRATDKAGNVEATKSLALKVDTAAPTTTAALDPGAPGAGGTYEGQVGLTLTAADAVSGVARSEYQVNVASAFGAFGAPSLMAADWVTYDPQNKPVFSEPGAYTIDYRSVDNAGNVEEAKTVTFTIAGDSNDTLAPVTTSALDPASPGAGRTYSVPVTVKFSAADPAPAGPEPKTFEVDAAGTAWEPADLTINNGDTVQWNFPAEDHFPHDVWVIAPGGDPAPGSPDRVQVTQFPVNPGGPSVSKTFTQNGEWTFFCSLHASYVGGEWDGMAGTITVEPAEVADLPSGVDFTEYRVKTGDAQGDWVRVNNTGSASPFESQVTIDEEGQHTVEYRSVDKAGNVEETKSVSFGIDFPEPGTPVIEAFADPSSGTAPLLVRFSATGYDPDGTDLTYRWEFADGSYLGRAVTRTFTKPGNYTATVTATDEDGESTSKEVTVTVTQKGAQAPTLEASASATTVPAGSAVQFTAQGDDPDGDNDDLLYAWDFGDGLTSFEQNPSHVYALPGTYQAKVTVSDATGASANKTITITVTDPPGNQAPVVQVAALPTGGEAPLEVQFSATIGDPDGDAMTYEWDFDDGSPTKTGSASKKSTIKTEHTYTSAGTYEATLTVSDGKGESTTESVTVVVGNPPANQPPTVEIAADPKSGTAPLTVQFSSRAVDPEGKPLIVTWDFGDGGQAAGATATHTYIAPGTYTATVTARDQGGLSATATVEIVVAAPQAAPNNNNGGGGSTSAAAAPAPKPNAWFGVAKPAKTTLAKFAKRGLKVQVTCTESMRGTAKLTLSSKLRKQLGLKSATIASRSIKCAGAGSKTITLKPSKKVQRALKGAKGSVKAKLGVTLRAAGESAKKSTRTVTLASR